MKSKLFIVWLLAFLVTFGYNIYNIVMHTVAEWNDVDDYTRVIIDKKPGVVEWTTSTGGKASSTIRHQDGAIWIKARSDVDGSTCVWAERNPFNVEGYVIGERYDFKNHHIQKCSKDTSPNGNSAVGWLLVLMFSAVVLGLLLPVFDFD